MKLLRLVPAAVLVFYANVASAQNWFEYVNLEDQFTVNFPEDPTITESPYLSEYQSHFTARKYAASDGTADYEITVVDMANSERAPGLRGNEWRGAVAFEAAKMRRTGEVTLDAYNEINVVPGIRLQLNLPDGRRQFSTIHFCYHNLYIITATAPANVPPPAIFIDSFSVVDGEGNSIRFLDEDYSFPDRIPIGRVAGQPVAN
jgi:hypothetical protein